MVETLFYIDKGPNKMRCYLGVFTDPKSIVEELLTLFLRPTVITLVDGDNKLLRCSQKIQ